MNHINNIICIKDYNLNKYLRNNNKLIDYSKEDLELLLENNSIIYTYYNKTEIIMTVLIEPRNKSIILEPMLISNKYINSDIILTIINDLNNKIKAFNYKYIEVKIHPDNLNLIDKFIKNNFILKDTIESSLGLRNIYIKTI